MNTSPEIITVMGLIGIGKTRAINLLSERLQLPVVQEDFSGNPFFEDFYKNPKKYAFRSQLYFLLAKIQGLLDHQKKSTGPSLVDTPIEQDVFSYAKAHFSLGNITPAEWDLYKKTYQLGQLSIPPTSAIVYLTASLNTVVSRIKGRDREAEQDIDPGYLILLHVLNSEFIDNTTIPVVRIPTDKLDLVNTPHDKERFVSRVQEFLLRVRQESI